jgi:hypothetical protein
MLRPERIALAAALALAPACGGSAAPAASTSPLPAPQPSAPNIPAMSYQPTAQKGEAVADEELTPESVYQIIQAKYTSGLERCHEELLVREPSADGAVALEFTVDRTGHVVAPKVKGFDAGIDDCIAQRTTAWTFPVPKGKDGAPTTASFRISLRLEASR